MEIINSKLAETFLYRLRYATIVEQRITTDENELAQVAFEIGIDKTEFFKAYHSEQVKQALQDDFNLRAKFGVRALPAYLFCYGKAQILHTGVLDFDDFVQAIHHISDGIILPEPPIFNEIVLQNFLQKRALVSLTEIRHAFNLADNQSVIDWLEKVSNQWRWVDGEFVETR